MIRIAQAARPESGKGKWGVPPNQLRTGVTKDKPEGKLDGELEVRAFYGGWEKVFRCTDAKIADKIAWIMERIVANGKYIGYGQNNGQYPRTLVFDCLNQMGKPDPLQIKALCNCDCSSSAGASIYFAGIYEPKLRDMWTGTERAILLGTGKFVELTDALLLQSGRGIRRGDVLWKEGHTAIAVDTDNFVDTVPSRIANCKACNLRTGPGTEYKIIRALGSGSRVDEVSVSSNGWHQVIEAGTYGFVSGKYIAPLPTMTATGNVWLRKGAGTDKAKLIVIPQGATVYKTGRIDKVLLTTWHEVIYAGKQGYASGKYLR